MIFNLVCILRIVACVDAASRMFQPQLQAPVLSSLRSNATTAHQKRWLGVQTGPDNHNIKLWPNGEVKYSISSENEEDQKVLPNLIQQATELWHGSGLPANFKFTEVEQLWCISSRPLTPPDMNKLDIWAEQLTPGLFPHQIVVIVLWWCRTLTVTKSPPSAGRPRVSD